MKFGRRLYEGRGEGSRREQALEYYKKAWKALYDSPPAMDGSAPRDFSNNPNITCPGGPPWWQPSTTSQIPVGPPLPPLTSPVAGSSTQPGGPGLAFPGSQALDNFLKTHGFSIDLQGSFPKISGGFIPNYQDYLKEPKKLLKVVYVISPDYRQPREHVPSAMNTKALLDKDDYNLFKKEDPLVIWEMSRDRKTGKIECHYHAWVRFTI